MPTMCGRRRVSIHLVMNQMPHTSAGKVKAGNAGDHDERDCTEDLDPTGHGVGRSARQAGLLFGDRMQAQFSPLALRNRTRCTITYIASEMHFPDAFAGDVQYRTKTSIRPGIEEGWRRRQSIAAWRAAERCCIGHCSP